MLASLESNLQRGGVASTTQSFGFSSISGDAALRLGDGGGMSLGLTGFASLNTVQSFAGVGLEVAIGRWR